MYNYSSPFNVTALQKVRAITKIHVKWYQQKVCNCMTHDDKYMKYKVR